MAQVKQVFTVTPKVHKDGRRKSISQLNLVKKSQREDQHLLKPLQKWEKLEKFMGIIMFLKSNPLFQLRDLDLELQIMLWALVTLEKQEKQETYNPRSLLTMMKMLDIKEKVIMKTKQQEFNQLPT